MEDLLRALIQGGQGQPSPYATRSGGDPLAAVLQGLLGGVASQGESGQTGPGQGGADLGTLLQGILGGAGQAPQSYGQQAGTGSGPAGLDLASLLGGGPVDTGHAAHGHGEPPGPGPAPSGLDLASLLEGGPGGTGQAPQSYGQQTGAGSPPAGLDLGSLLGGGAVETGQAAPSYGQQTGTGSVPAGLDLGTLLQAILGGTGGVGGGTQVPAASGAGGFGDLLGAIMGGGSSTMSSDPFIGPIVNGLAEKLGLPPQIVQAVVTFVLGKLLSNRLQPAVAVAGVSGTAGATRRRGTTVEAIRQKTNRRKLVTKKELRSSGLAKELSAHTGLDRATAETSLQEVLKELGRQLGAGE